MNSNGDATYLVIRVANIDDVDPVNELEKCISKNGSVWFGKYGRGISPTQLRAFDVKTKKYAILVNKPKPGKSYDYSYHWYEIKSFSRTTPSNGNFPEYYKPVINRIGTWLELRHTQMDMPGINDLYTKSSFNPVTESLSKSMSAHFFCFLRK